MPAVQFANPPNPAVARQTRPAPRRLSDEEVVELAATILADPRVWTLGDLKGIPMENMREASRRAIGLLREAMATV